MVFGFFTSIVPYIVAAGIYAVYLLFSFLQPSQEAVQKEKLVSDSKQLVSNYNSDNSELDNAYDFESAFDKSVKSSFNSGPPFFNEYRDPFHDSLSNSPPEYRIPMQFEYSVKILSDLFFRPPPMC
jgi:hypothetical protein